MQFFYRIIRGKDKWFENEPCDLIRAARLFDKDFLPPVGWEEMFPSEIAAIAQPAIGKGADFCRVFVEYEDYLGVNR